MILTKVVRARKSRRCSRCNAVIDPGQLYNRTTISPNDPDVGNEGWWRLATCVVCIEFEDPGR